MTRRGKRGGEVWKKWGGGRQDGKTGFAGNEVAGQFNLEPFLGCCPLQSGVALVKGHAAGAYGGSCGLLADGQTVPVW